MLASSICCGIVLCAMRAFDTLPGESLDINIMPMIIIETNGIAKRKYMSMTISDYAQIGLNVLLAGGVIFGVMKGGIKKAESEDKHDFLVSLDIKNLQQRLEDERVLRTNHLHMLEVKLDALTGSMSDLGKEVVKLNVIIGERIPRTIHIAEDMGK